MQKQEEKGTGFLITCDKNKQKQAIKDAYNFLNEYIQQIYGDIETTLIHKQLDKQGKDHNLQNQIQVRSQFKNKLKILSSIDTNVNCLIFIKINQKIADVKIDPLKIVNAIMKDVHKQDRQLTRFCHKILPVQRSFKAQHFKMLDQIDNLFQQRDNSQIKSWALSFKCRNNSKFSYKQVLAKTDQIAKKYGHFADIYYPQWTVAVQIVHHLMCIAIVEGYKEYDQFRLHKKGQKIHNNNEHLDKNNTIKQKKLEKFNKDTTQKQDRTIKQTKLKIQTPEDQKRETQNKQHTINLNKQHNEQQEQDNKIKGKLLQQKIQVNDDQDVDFI